MQKEHAILVEEHFEWALATAGRIAARMRFRDRDNAVGEAMLNFAAKIVPQFKGPGDFRGWATLCLRRSLISSQRREASERAITIQDDERNWLEGIQDRDPRKPRGVNFHLLSRWLTRRQAMLLKLRFREYMTPRQAATRLGVSLTTVKYEMLAAIRAVRVHWGARFDELPANNHRKRGGQLICPIENFHAGMKMHRATIFRYKQRIRDARNSASRTNRNENDF